MAQIIAPRGSDPSEHEARYISEFTHPFEEVEIEGNVIPSEDGDTYPKIRVDIRPDPCLQKEGTSEDGPWVEWTIVDLDEDDPGVIDLPSMSEEACEALIAALQRSLDNARKDAADRGWRPAHQ